MTLRELKKMIAEEYNAFKKRKLNEQADMPDMPMVGVTDADVDATGAGGDDAEATLRDIYEMLKDFFEGGGDDAGEEAEDVEDVEDAEDVEGEEDEEADLEELKNHGVGKSAGKTTGKNAGYKAVKESKITKAKTNKLIAEAQMKARFKKLANINKK
jgi:hypothetical protein